MPLPFESREEVLAWICKNQLGRRNLTPEQKKFLIGKQYSVEHRKPGGNGNNQHTAAAKKTAPEELCQINTIPPTSAEASIRKQIAERNNVSESYVVRSEKFMRGVEIMEQMMPGMQEKILSGQFKVRDADMHRLARADFPNPQADRARDSAPGRPSRSAVELLTLLWNQLLRAGSRCPADSAGL